MSKSQIFLHVMVYIFTDFNLGKSTFMTRNVSENGKVSYNKKSLYIVPGTVEIATTKEEIVHIRSKLVIYTYMSRQKFGTDDTQSDMLRWVPHLKKRNSQV